MIKIRNLSKSYKGKKYNIKVLDNINMDIKQGEFTAIVGESGSGKSTLLRILGCLDKFDTGEYILDGVDIAKHKQGKLAEIRNSKIGFIFQNFSLIPEYTVYENIEMPMGYAGVKNEHRRKKVEELLARFNLEDKIDVYPNMISGGQQQRIAIARALSNNPKIILADEPTGNLDENNMKYVMELFKEINKTGVTVIMVTHDKVASSYADKIIEMEIL